MFAETFAFDSGSVTTWLIWFLALTTVLYFTRDPARRAILSLSRALHQTMRLAAHAVRRGEVRLGQRNREVLLAAGREASERIIEREFERMEAAVNRDLTECPALQRRLNERVSQIEEDHQKSTQVPPSPPGWVAAVEAVANIPSKGDPMVANVLDKIRSSLVEAQERALREYRGQVQERHQHLKNMMPHWRRLIQLVGQLDKNVSSLLRRAKTIDRHMDEYEEILKGTDRAARMLSSSSLTQFFISALVLAVAVGGAVINFHLIARPMAEMVGGNSAIGSFRTADVAALVIIMVEISMGLFLMESLRVTRLFPVIGALPDKLRVRMMWITFVILFMLASVEAGLAYMREILLQDELATSALLRGETAGLLTADFSWITTAAQMGMGFILPFALVFVAIPLETFFHSLRTVLGLASAAGLRGLAVLLRLIGSIAHYAGSLLVDLYDLLIFGPLWIETRLRKVNGNGSRHKRPTPTATEVTQ